MAGALLRSGSLSEFHPLGAVGKPVYSAASQLRAAVRRLYGSEAADLFAIPKRHDQGDVIDWYAPEPGPVVPWSAATAEERAEAVAVLRSARDRLAVQSQALQTEEETSERKVFGKLLAQATRIPGEDHIYLVNGRPVMTFWGFHPLDAAHGFDIIGGLVPAAATPSVAEVGTTVDPPPIGEVPPMDAPPQRRRWWLWLLPLLLLLLLLLIGLKSCGVPVPYTGWLPTLPLHGEPPPATTTPVEVPPELKPLLGPDGRPLMSAEGRSIYVDGDGRTVAVDAEGRLVPVDAEGKSLAETGRREEGAPPPGAPPTPVGEKPLEPGEAAPPSPAPDAAKPAPDDKTGADKAGADQTGADKADSPGAVQGPDAADATRPAGAPGTPLTIPEKAAREGDTRFLDGSWRSITGLQDKSGNPVDLSYEFRNGQGPVTLRRSVGGQQQTCTGTVGSTMEGGRLLLDQGQVRCPDGTLFEKSKVVCSPGADGKAKCQGINENGSTYDVEIVK
jgi:hypothetical protein